MITASMRVIYAELLKRHPYSQHRSLCQQWMGFADFISFIGYITAAVISSNEAQSH